MRLNSIELTLGLESWNSRSNHHHPTSELTNLLTPINNFAAVAITAMVTHGGTKLS